jgi:hypothetical protein
MCESLNSADIEAIAIVKINPILVDTKILKGYAELRLSERQDDCINFIVLFRVAEDIDRSNTKENVERYMHILHSYLVCRLQRDWAVRQHLDIHPEEFIGLKDLVICRVTDADDQFIC